MTRSPKKTAVPLPFKEDDTDLLTKAKALKDTRSWVGRSFTREEDYIIYTYWTKKPQNELAKLLGTSHHKIKPRYTWLCCDASADYIMGLITEFEGKDG